MRFRGVYSEQGERFSLRLPYPFSGPVAVVKRAEGRTLSLAGGSRQLEILAHRPPRGLWSREGYQNRLQYFRFELGSERSGLRRVPFNPMLDARHRLAQSEGLSDMVRRGLRELPFSLAEELELSPLYP